MRISYFPRGAMPRRGLEPRNRSDRFLSTGETVSPRENALPRIGRWTSFWSCARLRPHVWVDGRLLQHAAASTENAYLLFGTSCVGAFTLRFFSSSFSESCGHRRWGHTRVRAQRMHIRVGGAYSLVTVRNGFVRCARAASG